MKQKEMKPKRRLFTRTVTCAAISFIAGIIVMIPVMQVYAQNMYMSQVEQQAQNQIEQENVVTMQNMTTAKQEQPSFAKSNNQIELISFEGNGKGGTDLTQTVLSAPLNVLADNADIETISVSGDEIKLEPELPKISGTEMLKQQEEEPEEINISEGEEAEMSKQEEAEGEEAEMSKQEEAEGEEAEMSKQEEAEGEEAEMSKQEEAESEEAEMSKQEETESEEAEMSKQEETEGQQTEEIKIPASVVEQMQEQAEKKQEETSVSENNVQKEDEEETKEITTNKSVEMYEKPDTSSDKIRTLKKGVKLSNVEEVGGGWLKVTYKEKEGYICYLNTDYAEKSGKKVEVQEEYEGGTRGFVNGRNVNLRKYPGITTEVLDCLRKGTELEVISFNNLLEDEEYGWYLVVDKKTGKQGYMYGQYIYLGDELPKEEKQQNIETIVISENQPIETPSSINGQDIVNYAQQFLGTKYVYGASGPSQFDCSGFTMYVYSNFGVSLSHSAAAQSTIGVYVERENLKAGDLVFFKGFKDSSKVGHCGIYLGDGNFIHASSGSASCVTISSLSSNAYNSRYCSARRIA